jgi:hypothetical protein
VIMCDEPQKRFPLFWPSADLHLRRYLPELGVDDADAEVIRKDLLARCAHIEPLLPVDPESEVHFEFGALWLDVVSAEQRLFAAQHGRMPGSVHDDLWMTMGLNTGHPFLIELQKVLAGIEAQANRAEGGKRLN